jgi:hypothetical protein
MLGRVINGYFSSSSKVTAMTRSAPPPVSRALSHLACVPLLVGVQLLANLHADSLRAFEDLLAQPRHTYAQYDDDQGEGDGVGTEGGGARTGGDLGGDDGRNTG